VMGDWGATRGSWFAVLAAALLSFWMLPGRAAPRLGPNGVPPRPLATASAPPGDDDDSVPDPCLEGLRLLGEYGALYGSPEPGAHPPRGRFEPLIVLVPDPVASGHTDDFDSVFEGVEEAMGEGDTTPYVRDRSWLPWPGTDSGKRKLKCWQRQPGVVIYRPTQAPANHAAKVVLLVGETPTWGLRREPFEAALALADTFWPEPRADTRSYKIIGPTYSGTEPSLEAILRRRFSERAARSPRVTFSISSGSATDPGIGGLLEQAAPREDPTAVAYWSATPTDDELLHEMLTFLSVRGALQTAPPCNVVLLSESLTAYGSAIGSSATREVCWEGVKFPPNLQAVREAYAGVANAVEGDGGAPSGSTSTTSNHREDEGDLSDQTPAVHALDLREKLRELSQRHVRFLGIAATDPRDVVFMAARVHEDLPDMQLFTLGADIRYLDPDNATTMNGVLIAHSGRVPEPSYRSTALENDMVRNVYLAARHLLTGSVTRGSVIISVLGNGSLRQIGPDDLPGTDSDSPFQAPHLPTSWAFVSAMTFAALAIVLVIVFLPAIVKVSYIRGLVRQLHAVAFLRHRGRLWSIIAPCDHVDLAAQDRLVTASLLCVSVCPPLVMLVSTFAHRGAAPNHSCSFALVVLTLLAVATMWRTAHGSWGRADPGTRIITVAVTTAAVLALGVACRSPSDATFHLMSGGSPVLVALVGLTIFIIGGLCWRMRLRFLDFHRFGSCSVGDDRFADTKPPIAQALGEDRDESPTGLVEIERSLLRVIERPWSGLFAVPASVHLFLGLSIAIPLALKPPHTFEPGWRNTLLVAFGCLAFLPITGNLSRLLATWFALRPLLRRLAARPGLDALRRLPPRLARPVEAQLSLSGGEIIDLAYPLTTLGSLSELVPELSSCHGECKALLEEELQYETGTDAVSSKASKGLDTDSGVLTRRARLAEQMLQTSSVLSRSTAAQSPAVRALIDEYIASLVAIFLPRYVRHFRLYFPPLIVGSILTTLMTSLYFVQPQSLIMSMISVWVTLVVLTLFIVYVSLDRDPIISAMGNRPANAVTWNWSLLRRVLAWGAFPLLSLLAAQYPDIGFWVSGAFGWVAKGLR
jgi:hypothetical protein